MARPESTPKSTTRRTADIGTHGAHTPDTDTPEQQAERLAKGISESAQQIWLAGLGAFSRAQAEGTKLFEGLVKEGQGLEKSARKLADKQTEAVREVVEARVARAREHAVGSWGKAEKVFEEYVRQALTRLGIPGHDDFMELARRIDELNAQLLGIEAGTKAGRPAPAASKTARKKPTAAAVKKAAKKAAPRKSAAKKTSARRTTSATRQPRKP